MVTQFTDYELVVKSLKEDQDAFAELVGRYKRLIFSAVSYYIKDYEEINDISQEVFLRIYKALKSYNPQYRFSTWSITIAKNICLDYLRKNKIPVESIEGYEGACRDENTPENTYLGKEKRDEIRTLINRLPEQYKEVIVLYHHKGLSYNEICEKLNKPMSIVKNRLYRARMRLKEDILSSGMALGQF